MSLITKLAKIAFYSNPEEGGKPGFGEWEDEPEFVHRIYERMARAIFNEAMKKPSGINEMIDLCHGNAKEAGWWPENTNLPEKICLMHSELSEAMEGLRKDLMDDKLPHRKMEEVEMADAVIRIFDYCGHRGFDLEGAIMEKLAFNETREDHKLENRAKEGGKKF